MGHPFRYYIPEDNAGFMDKVWRFISKKELPAWSFPRVIQIQTVAGCNAFCIFCPHGKTKRPLPKGRMDWDLYRTIIDECVRHRMWRISPYLMNEPLLDPEIGERIRYISSKKRFPTYTKINTNASLLTEEVARDLLDSGLDVLTCSVHGIVKEKYEKTMVGLKLEKVLDNIDRFLELKAKLRKKKPELRVTMIRTKLIEPDVEKIREYWKRRGVRVSIRPMSNRANPQIADLGVSARPLEPFSWCVRPMEQAYVNVRGELLLCCNDWEQTTILGDLKTQSLEEAWNGDRYREIRRRLLDGRVQGLLCEKCTMQRE
ncbi:radical SAM/SPASM domain-containing protein [Thermodesulforhabdus norvegica]|uniref:Radical SAM superfamily protein n=1 Tax=Thermodesulforhabdus norvegica TaxID=39841 RepID=A0A1I4R121_9BACT|nr:radical SAM/SPASM domain-containing protein [Thermodesulforhabdus norvegica]SFM45666.1 Radical SAM superfamily protein [Thermodesulforhabdus norvegica]